MNASGIAFEFDEESNAWISNGGASFLGDELNIRLSAEGAAGFDQQSEILAQALALLPRLENEAKQRLFEFYQGALEDFEDLAGTELLPLVESPDSLNQIFGLSELFVPEQLPGRGVVFKIVGGCSWNEEDGVQLFFRDGILEQVDSDAQIFL